MKVQVEELAMVAELKEVMKFLMIIEHEFISCSCFCLLQIIDLQKFASSLLSILLSSQALSLSHFHLRKDSKLSLQLLD